MLEFLGTHSNWLPMRKARALIWTCGSPVGPVSPPIMSGSGKSWLPKLGPPLDAVSETALALKNPYNFIFAPLPSLMSGISPPCFGTSIGKTRNGVTAGTTVGPSGGGGVLAGATLATFTLLTGTRYTAATTVGLEEAGAEAFNMPGVATVWS